MLCLLGRCLLHARFSPLKCHAGIQGVVDDATDGCTVSNNQLHYLTGDVMKTKHKSLDKKDKKHKKEKKHKKGKRAQHASDSGSSEDEHTNLEEQLQREKAAISTLRSILSEHPDVKKDLRQGTWQQGAAPVLPVLGPVFDEPIRSMPAPVLVAATPAPAQPPPHVANPPPVTHPGDTCEVEDDVSSSGQEDEVQRSPSRSPSAAMEQPAAAREEEAATENGHDTVSQPRRYGPAMPSAEMLAAAQAAAAHYDAMQHDGDDGASEDPFVGPVPPDMIDDYDSVPQDRREAEVIRVLRVLRKTAEGQPPDAYEVLEVEQDAAVGDIKKQYWKMSLLIHPDKCTHPAANEAFQAVTAAAKQLQDASGRLLVDERRKDDALRRRAEDEAAAQLREHQWKVARGEVDPNAPPPGPPGPLKRDTWMTELPTAKGSSVHDIMTQKSVKAFSMLAPKAAQDKTWTMSPLDRENAAQMLLESGGVARIEAGPLERPAAAMDPAMMAVYDKQQQKKSLLEQHVKKETKKKRKQEAGTGAPEKEEWEGKHPWKPWDHEKEMSSSQPSAKHVKGLLKDAQSLGSRFSSSQPGERKFL